MCKKYINEFHREIIINESLAVECSINRLEERPNVNPFTLAQFVYHAIHTLKLDPKYVIHILLEDWNKIKWNTSTIHINYWNRLFNGKMLPNDWKETAFPLYMIDSLERKISGNIIHTCIPVFIKDVDKFLYCSIEAYKKTFDLKKANKITVYQYKETGFDLIKQLQKDVKRITITL